MKKLNSKLNFTLLLAALALLGLVSCEDDVIAPTPVTYVQIDREGIPAINAALIPANLKDAFNQGAPKDDIANFRPTAQATITGLRNAVNAVSGFPPEDSPGISAAALAAVLIPDVVTINFAQPVLFPNGRRLEDDVIDAALGLILNRGGGVSDAIDSNDKAFLPAFPYMAAEN